MTSAVPVKDAVVGKLDFRLGTNGKNTGAGGHTPQSLFPPTLPAGDPNGEPGAEDGDNDRRRSPSRIVPAITAQESDTGRPLVSPGSAHSTSGRWLSARSGI
ncbi:hypothetical protein [Streptomyces cyaneofuscatus]|uniref:hypothetical protein n=1 Tax=Streptomyces cyaneofuscatus TaxID=66883 RepID=UPI0036A70AD3